MQCLDPETAHPRIPLPIRSTYVSLQEKCALVKPQTNHNGEEVTGHFLLFLIWRKKNKNLGVKRERAPRLNIWSAISYLGNGVGSTGLMPQRFPWQVCRMPRIQRIPARPLNTINFTGWNGLYLSFIMLDRCQRMQVVSQTHDWISEIARLTY